MNPWKQIEQKIFRAPDLVQQIAEWRKNKVSLVFTNGCFDLLHFGHIRYLAEAKSLGTHLIVGLNSSASVSRLKGVHRPIKDEKTRAHLLAALQCVDAVVVFDEDTPLELIRLVQPDVLVKGGDWAPEQIVGSEVVLSRGGEVKSLAFVEGYSTTALEKKILDSFK